ncbi:hypothetical protein JCM13664_04450 [Methylothermus subterraneus]
MQASRIAIALLAPPSSALAHSGPHLDEATLEAIFQFMDRTYENFLTHLPLIGGIAAGLLALLAARRIWRRAR